MLILSELHYHPPAAFFAALHQADSLVLEAQEHYHKQTYRNRCLIRTAQGVQPLTVPVVAGNRSEKVKTADIEIDYRQNWVHRHSRTLQTAYGNSPYFEYYADYLHDIYRQRISKLFELNLAFLRLELRCFRLTLPISTTTEYHAPGAPESSELTDRRDWLSPKGNADRPDNPAALRLVRPYPQVFGPGFEPGLSVLDLLFAQGPAAGLYLG